MNMNDWDTLADGVFAAHGKAKPCERMVAKWFEHTHDIPAGPAGEIAQKMETAIKLESNFGAQFKMAWNSWRVANPERCSREDSRHYGCRDCQGGFMWVGQMDAAGWAVWSAPLCRCSSQYGTTKADLEAKGLYVDTDINVIRWAADYNRAKSGFTEQRGECKDWGTIRGFNIKRAVEGFRNSVLTEEDAALMVQ